MGENPINGMTDASSKTPIEAHGGLSTTVCIGRLSMPFRI